MKPSTPAARGAARASILHLPGDVDARAAHAQHRAAMSDTEDRMTLTHDRRAELLAGCPLFKGIDAAGLAALAARAEQVDFPAGHLIARQGEIGTGFFVIIKGSVRVVRDGEVVARLGAGEFFGELSVLDRMPRNATVTSEVATTCLALASWDFEKVLLEQPALTLSILRGVAGRLRSVSESARH
jgi:CRP/FNR family transcriptional regulator, cyclic AMP receptor protein